MLTYTDLKPGTKFVMDGDPYVVLEYSFVRMQMRKPVVQTKIKNLISGNVVAKAFYPRDMIEEAEIETKEVKFLYANKGEVWVCPPDKPGERYGLKEDIVGIGVKFLKANSIVKAILFSDKIISIEVPIKVELKVVEAPPAVRGNTAQGVTKQVKLETGATILTPIFINEGDVLRINTETGQYVERVIKG